MRIAIDARMYGTKQRGIGRYLMKLIENLETISSLRDGSPSLSDDARHQFTIFLRRANFDEYQPKNRNFKKALWDVPWYGIREQIFFWSLLKIRDPISPRYRGEIGSPDIVHFPHWNIPLFFRRSFIVTIHDLQLFSSSRVRESTTRGQLTYALKFLAFKIIFRHAVLAARAIIVPSNYVKDCLVAKYPRLKEKICVIYEAPTIDGIRNYESGIMGLVNGKYVLYVGSAYPHKNLERLLKAWNIIREKLPDYKLVLVGKEDFFWKRIKAELFHAQSSALNNAIIFYGPASDEDLATLYKNASLLIQPSLEEGFSLTPLEALYFGCPAAVSDIPAHREILQDYAAYFDPKDENAIANTIKNHLENKVQQKNADELLSRYSWRKHAKETTQIYLCPIKRKKF